jgi:hypothetical protein
MRKRNHAGGREALHQGPSQERARLELGRRRVAITQTVFKALADDADDVEF